MGASDAHDENAERALLGTLIQFPATVAETTARVSLEDFWLPAHRIIYRSILNLLEAGDPLSAPAVLSELDGAERLKRAGGAPYLADLIQIPTTPHDVEHYIKLVLDKSRLRRIRELAARLNQCSELDADSAVEAVHRFLEEARVEREASADDFDSAYRSWVDWYEDDQPAIPTPWQGINQMLYGGWHRGRLYTITGRPGAGKSALSLQAILHAASAGYRSVVYSMEMGREECMSRILAAATGVPLKNLMMHRLSAEDRSKIEGFATNPSRPLMKIDDNPSQTIESIVADCRARKKDGLDLVAIDHSLLLSPSDKRWALHQQVTHVAKTAKLLARRLDCAVLLLHQMNRGVEGDKRKPLMKDLREGGEMDSDVIIALTRDGDEQFISASLLKNRMGRADQAASLVDELAYGRLG